MPTPALEPVDRRATADLIAEAVRERIMDGSFEPGVQLTEAQLAEQLQVSRGPVREAFQRLVQEGLLRAEPHRGVFVTELGADDVADVYLARGAVERAAAQVLVRAPAAEREPVLATLRRLVDRMASSAGRNRWGEVAEADLAFHAELVAGAGSPRLSRLYDTLLVETRLCLRTVPGYGGASEELVDEHRALLHALTAGDEPRVLACVEDHLSRAAGSAAGRT